MCWLGAAFSIRTQRPSPCPYTVRRQHLCGRTLAPAFSPGPHTEHGPVGLARPLLGFRKAELEAVCRQRGLPFVVDPTNADLSFQRNRIRHLLHRYPLPPAGSAGSDGSGTRQAAAAARAEDSTGCGNGTPTLVDDLLLLQRRCEAVARQQDAAAAQLLEQAVRLTSCNSLLRRHRQAGSMQGCQPQQQQQQQQLLQPHHHHSMQQCAQQQGRLHGSDAQRWPYTQQVTEWRAALNPCLLAGLHAVATPA